MSGKTNVQRTKKTASKSGGMKPEIMKAIIDKIPPNTVTGKVELNDIMKYMAQNPEEMDTVMKSMEDLRLDDKDIDLSQYDFASLAPKVRHESFWVLQLEHMGMVDASGRPVDPSKAHATAGARPTFMVYCYDDRRSFRMTQECNGIPTSATVLQVLRCAIAKPLPPLMPELPWFLLLSTKFKDHIDELAPFLDSLPAPFHWRLETPEEVESLKEGIWKLNENGVRKALVSADKLKAAGNAAFTRKDGPEAVKAYSGAVDALIDVLSMTPDVEDEKKARKQLAVCYANRAAAYLISGAGVDAKRAIEDGKAAEHWDPAYAKAYIRQATAHQLLGDTELAKDVVARALHLPELENDNGLVDRLIDLYTNGEGLSNNEEIFKNWILDVKINDRRGSERLRGINGEWRRRLDAQFKRWKL
ncbi:hypothetical protein D9615_001803 [Tricholomella constricta]|uniref:Uncharacterized protein n=1 Tax=Tricholomella constricta TaxID=117010 RepID=A0A8H5MAS5_9AGAR|nr:hypothetical protein D9615_001803 [Tricholomella constricta]